MGIGPSTKETTLHRFRDPLLDIMSADEDFDLMGIMLVGTPQDDVDKHFVSRRAAAWAECMRTNGAIVSSDGWGNSDIDLANILEELGTRGIPAVGLKFSGKNGGFVVQNDYLDNVLDINKSTEGIETNVVGENNVTALDARKACARLKLLMRK